MRDTNIPLARTKTDFLLQPRNPLGSKGKLQLIKQAPAPVQVGPSVAILLCIYHGEHFLEEQLESIAQQTHTNWKLYISDDGECEESLKIIKRFSRRFEPGRIVFIEGPKQGFVANFLSLTSDTAIDADYFAYSDQDDIWHKDKLEVAIQRLSEFKDEIPSLYCSRTVIVNQNNDQIGLSTLFCKQPTFANALVQNIGGGNTMVFNKCSRHLLAETKAITPVASHDWWAYILIAGCGGKVFYDFKPSLRYRIHATNLVGENLSAPALLKRLLMVWQGRFRNWNELNITALREFERKLCPENRVILERFARARQMSLVFRLINLKLSGVHRQTLIGNLGLIAAAIFRRL